jgi:hypothetical protein
LASVCRSGCAGGVGRGSGACDANSNSEEVDRGRELHLEVFGEEGGRRVVGLENEEGWRVKSINCPKPGIYTNSQTVWVRLPIMNE